MRKREAEAVFLKSCGSGKSCRAMRAHIGGRGNSVDRAIVGSLGYRICSCSDRKRCSDQVVARRQRSLSRSSRLVVGVFRGQRCLSVCKR
jgi:hypothetical protein